MKPAEQSKPPEEGGSNLKRGESKVRHEGQNSVISPDFAKQQARADQEKVGELRRIIGFSPVEATSKRDWADKEVDLNSINLRELPIGWQSLANIGRDINGMKDDPIERKDLAFIKPPPEAYQAVHMVASVVANKRNPSIPVLLPTEAEVKAMRPWLAIMGRFIGRFSQNWARKFEGYIERRGQQVVIDVGLRISTVAEQLDAIENPQQQFIVEMTGLYNHLARPEYVTSRDLFDEYQEEIKIEDKINRLLTDLKHVKYERERGIYTKDNFPILTTVLPMTKMPPDTLLDNKLVSLAGAELMEGIHIFLKQEGVTNLMPVPRPQEFNLFDPSSWGRGIAETFFAEKLEKVKSRSPNVLTHIHKGLPQNGPQLSSKIYDVAENICVLKAQGKSSEEIAHHIFVK